MKDLAKDEALNFHMFDTTDKNERRISIEVANTILNDMRNYYLSGIKNEIEARIKQ